MSAPTLKQLQAYWQGYFQHEPDATRQLSQWVLRQERLAVYNATHIAGMSSALASTYPVVAELVGVAFFNELAKRYIHNFPALSPNLADYGAVFADFINTIYEATSVPYLSDVARFEWIYQCALDGPDKSPIDLTEIVDQLAIEGMSLGFSLQKNLYLYESPYPVDAIWHWHQETDRPEWKIEEQTVQLLIGRPKHQVEIVRLNALMFQLLQSLQRGDSLQVIADQHPDMDETTLVGLLQVAFENEWLGQRDVH